jgi:hypothetical protein
MTGTSKAPHCIGMPHLALPTIDDIGFVVNADAARRVPSLCEPYAGGLSRDALMRPCVCLLVILEAAERAAALLENATPRFMRVRVAHWSLETPAFSVKTPWCTNLADRVKTLAD